MIDLAAVITLWIEETKIENPEALQLRVDVDLWYAQIFLLLCELEAFLELLKALQAMEHRDRPSLALPGMSFPTTESSNDPSCPSQRTPLMRVLLLLGPAL